MQCLQIFHTNQAYSILSWYWWSKASRAGSGILLCPFCFFIAQQPHQSSHLCSGFMGAFALQPKCLENSRELEMEPMTLNFDGLWGSVIIPSCELSGVLTAHHTCKSNKTKKESCDLFKTNVDLKKKKTYGLIHHSWINFFYQGCHLSR